MYERANDLDWDNKNEFNEGVTAFEFTLLNPLGVPTNAKFFDGNGLAGDLLDKPFNNADTFLVTAESSCTNTSVANVTRTRDIVVKRMQYKVKSVGSGLTVQDQFDQCFEWAPTKASQRGAKETNTKRAASAFLQRLNEEHEEWCGLRFSSQEGSKRPPELQKQKSLSWPGQLKGTRAM